MASRIWSTTRYETGTYAVGTNLVLHKTTLRLAPYGANNGIRLGADATESVVATCQEPPAGTGLRIVVTYLAPQGGNADLEESVRNILAATLL